MQYASDYVTIKARCRFCNTKIELRQHYKSKVRNAYYCNGVCYDDYIAVKDKNHPRHREALKYYQRFQGKEFSE